MNFDNDDRLIFFISTFLITIMVFRFNVIITVVPFECWSIGSIWKYQEAPFSLFSLYVVIFSLYAIYGLIELSLSVWVTKSIFARVVSPLLTLASIGFLVVMYCFWSLFEIQSGEASFEDYPIQLKKIRKPEVFAPFEPDFPSRKEILKSERCDKGLAISTMTEDDWGKIYAIEEAYYIKARNKQSQ